MFYVLAQAEAANQERAVDHLLNLVETVFTNPISMTMIFALSVVVVTVLLKYRHDLRRAEIDGTLKQEMIQRGMSADEIERVLAAKTDGPPRTSDSASKQTGPYPGTPVK